MGVRDGLGGNPFDAFHPSVTFAYLACAIALCMGAFHPVCAGISLVGALVAVACARFAFYPRLGMPVLWWGYAPYVSFVLAPAALYARERLAWRS